ncbi:MAG: hypothetical protein ACKVOK_12820 [Flavobacteriales bacterium]
MNQKKTLQGFFKPPEKRKYMFRKNLTYLFILTLTSFAFSSFAQNETLSVYGQLKDESTKKKLDNCTVQVFKDGTLFDTYEAGSTGKYEFKMPLGSNYDIKFSKGGYASKIIRIDTRNIPAEDRAGGFESNIDGFLFEAPEGFNLDILSEPMAKAAFDSETNAIIFDFDYTERRQEIIDEELKRLEELAKNLGKLEKQFEELVKAGDSKMIEEKYTDAVAKYSDALKLIKDREPAVSKLAEAKRKEAEANAGKELEAKYKKFIDEGEIAFKAKSWKDARSKYTEAGKLKPAEQLPKDMLAKIEEEEKRAGKRVEYDKIVADADAKFNNKDYAVCIEKYKEASAMMPQESHPKDQILKAQRALDDMLADEATRQKREAEYQAKLTSGKENFEADKLDLALKSYKDASSIKPEEDLPKKKIDEIEKLIADRKKKADEESAVSAADGERERIEREYNEHVGKADAFFGQEKWNEARAEYTAALEVKPEAQYPKQRLQRIDLLVGEDEARLERERRKAEEDSLRRARAAEVSTEEGDKAALLRQAQEDRERRWAELEEARVAENQKLIDSKKERNWEGNADAAAEMEVEHYYEDALQKERQARYTEVQKKEMGAINLELSEQKKQNEQIAAREEIIDAKVETKKDLEEKGISWNNRNSSDMEKKKEAIQEDFTDYKDRSELRQQQTSEDLAIKEEFKTSLPQNDRNRIAKVEDMEDKKEVYTAQKGEFIEKGNARVTDNNIKAEERMEELKAMTYAGEETRQANQHKLEEKMEVFEIAATDNRTASEERIAGTQQKIDKKAEAHLTLGEGKDKTEENAKAIEEKREQMEYEALKSDVESANKRYDKRKESINKESGKPKDPDSIKPVPGTEELPEGVSENSYKQGNKTVTERIVKVGNKVNYYKKVVSKTGIYYFKDGKSITETIWKQETLKSTY